MAVEDDRWWTAVGGFGCIGGTREAGTLEREVGRGTGTALAACWLYHCCICYDEGTAREDGASMSSS